MIRWNLPRPQRTLPGNEIHVWRIELDCTVERAAQLARSLDESERARATRFRFDRDRSRYIVSHAALRSILASYLGLAPHGLAFSRRPGARPTVVRPDGPDFSLSRGSGLALLAVGWGVDLGVDIERIRPDRADLRLANRLFPPGEAEVLRSLPEPLRTPAFFRGWTRFEARRKALGTGIAGHVPNGPERSRPRDWVCRTLEPGSGHAATLVFEGPERRVRGWTWPTGGRQASRRGPPSR